MYCVLMTINTFINICTYNFVVPPLCVVFQLLFFFFLLLAHPSFAVFVRKNPSSVVRRDFLQK